MATKKIKAPKMLTDAMAEAGAKPKKPKGGKPCAHKRITAIGNEETGLRSAKCDACGAEMRRQGDDWIQQALPPLDEPPPPLVDVTILAPDLSAGELAQAQTAAETAVAEAAPKSKPKAKGGGFEGGKTYYSAAEDTDEAEERARDKRLKATAEKLATPELDACIDGEHCPAPAAKAPKRPAKARKAAPAPKPAKPTKPARPAKPEAADDHVPAARKDKRVPPNGTKLRREWNGKQVEVVVKPTGFEFKGKTFTSLSAIANEVTGASWNGFRFFGLVK